MKTQCFALAALLMSSTATFAGVCGPDRDTDIPVMEASKAAFLNADYRKFVELGGDYFPDLDSNFNNYFGQIQVVFPNGFERCETVLQRREAPGFNQDLTFYFPKGSPAPLALLLVSVTVGGEERLIEFTYNTSISEVVDDLN